MKKNLFAWAVACMLAAGEAGAQNPIIQTRYTADPAACVYGGYPLSLYQCGQRGGGRLPENHLATVHNHGHGELD